MTRPRKQVVLVSRPLAPEGGHGRNASAHLKYVLSFPNDRQVRPSASWKLHYADGDDHADVSVDEATALALVLHSKGGR